MTTNKMTADAYETAFDLNQQSVTDKLKGALEHAYDNCEFGIELYWGSLQKAENKARQVGRSCRKV